MAGRWRRWPAEQKVNSSISHLPDDIIRHIFSFLPFKDLVKTSVLSKQWRLAWTSTPRFDISVPSKYIVPLISRALSLCTATKVEKFHIHASKADFSIDPEVERWLHFAAAHEVEDASLDFEQWCHYDAPPILSNCTSLVSLRVSGCLFDSRNTIHWPSLKNLCLPVVLLSTRSLTTILSGCPVLESLEFRAYSTLRIDSTSLRELVIEAVNVSSLDISAPNLLSLRLLGRFFSGLRLDGPSSLAEAELTFSEASACSSGNLWHFSDGVKVLLEQLRHVAKITIRSWCLEVLSSAEGRKMLNLSMRWRNIIVVATVRKRHLLGIACLLRSSPFLERLVICNPKANKLMFKNKDFPKHRYFEEEQFRRSEEVRRALLHLRGFRVSNTLTITDLDHEKSDLFGFDEKQFWRSREFYCVANHLKRVEIVGFQFDNEQSKLLLDLAKFLLEEAVGLEEMTIDVELRMSHGRVATDPHDLWGFYQLVRLQKGLHTVSPSAEVKVNYYFNGLPL